MQATKTILRFLSMLSKHMFKKLLRISLNNYNKKHNKNKIYILPTIQNYLKRSVARTNFEIEISKRKGLKFGAKLVRGAYIV